MSAPPGAPTAAPAHRSVTELLSPHALGAVRDVARTRERRRVVRLQRLVLVLLVPLAWLLFSDLAGHAPFSVHLPHAMIPYLPAVVLLTVMAVLMGGQLLGAGRSPHIVFRPSEIDIGLDDVVGIDGIRAEVVRTVNLFLGHETFRDAMGGVPRRGVLFEGPPGTGKTFVAKAMAKEADVPFLFVSASAFQSMYYGQTNRKVRSYFRALRRYANAEGGAIGFIEEFDAIGGSRHGVGTSGRAEGVSGVVNELLVQLQSFDTPTAGQRLGGAVIDALNRFLPEEHRVDKPRPVRSNILVVAATNRAADLDPALVRPGRFDRSIYFGLPGRGARQEILAYYLGTKAHAADLDGDDARQELAAMTFGYSPAALERLLDEALVVALTRGRTEMAFSDVAEAKMATELGLSDTAIYTVEERLRVATHEAGHATVAYFLGAGRKLDALSIVKRKESLGLLAHSDDEERFMRKRSEMAALLRIAMGGLAAEELFFAGDITSGPSGDLVGATQLACQMVGAFGMGGSLVSLAAGGEGPIGPNLVDKVLGDRRCRHAVDEMLDAAYREAKAIVWRERLVLEALRDALVARDELVGREITEVIEAVPGAAGRGRVSVRAPIASRPTPSTR